MSLATCTNHECERVLDVPGLPRTYRAPDGRCAKCAGLTPEQIMDIPAQVVAALRPIANEMRIERNVPLPRANHRGQGKGSCWLPLAQMGAPRMDGTADSFLAVCPQDSDMRSHTVRVRAAVNKWQKINKQKFTTRTEETGVRIWRTA